MKTKEELLARNTEIKTRVAEIDAQYQGQFLDPASEEGQEWNALNLEYDDNDKITKQMAVREARVAELGKDPKNTDKGASFLTAAPGAVRGDDIYDLSTVRSSASSPEGMRAELQDRAKRAIEAAHFAHQGIGREDAQGHVERMLAVVDDSQGSLARRVLVTGSPTYVRAFGKSLAGAQLTGAEISAISLGSGGGDLAVPFNLDPTIIPTSDGVVNPYRPISRVVQIVNSNEWKGVSSAGVVAQRVAEGSEATDGSPMLVQPTVTVTKADVFIPFSIELSEDWVGMQSEFATAVSDAKDVEEADSFTTGNGEDPNPEGLLTGATTTTTAGGSGSFASTDLDLVEQALPPRFRQRAQWIGSRTIYNVIRHFADDNGPDLWVRISEGLASGGNTGQTLLGYRANEASAMPAAHATNDLFLVLGDFTNFLIVDRIGMSVEIVPHLFGAYGRPTGQRGFYAYWRNACKVLTPNAFRVLKAG